MSNKVEVYMVVNLEIQDADSYRNYEKGFFPMLKKHSGRFVTFDDTVEHLEGHTPVKGRMIIFAFPSEEKAKEWFNDPEYQELSKIRRSSTSITSLTMVKGLPPRK